jgi:hypothetical protein
MHTIVTFLTVHGDAVLFPVTYKLNSVALARKRTISPERPPLVGEVSANFSG